MTAVDAALLSRFIDTIEGPVLVMDGNHMRGATDLELEMRAALRAQSSGLDVLGDYLTGLEYTLSRMPATGSRYTIAADSRLREAFRLVAAEYARLTEPTDE